MVALISEDTEKLLDNTGWAILRELQSNARIPFSELGRRVGLSSPAVAERVRRMEEAGIIQGYHAQLDLAAIGLAMQAIIRVSILPGKDAQIDALVRRLPEVQECYRVTGSDCMIMRVAVESVAHLEQLIGTLTPHSQANTALVLSTPVERRIIEG